MQVGDKGGLRLKIELQLLIILLLPKDVSWIIEEGLMFCFFLWLSHMICGILVPRPEIKPSPPALEAGSLNHWTGRDAPLLSS